MLQIYHFHDNDIDAVYKQANEFLGNVSTIPSVQIAPENIRTETKNYFNYDTSVTSINIIVDFKLATAQDIALVEKMHSIIITRSVGENAPVEQDDYDPNELFDDDDLP